MTKRKLPNICYYCGKPKQSREHVPPRSLFPKKKDAPNGKDYRTNPIVVPSCNEHNVGKSGDDEYLTYVLVLSIMGNDVAKNQFATAVWRAINRNKSLINRILANSQDVLVGEAGSDHVEPSLAVRAEWPRLKLSFDHIARALYFYEWGSVWQGEVKVMVDFLISLENAEENKRINDFMVFADEGLASVERRGTHPEVFSYQIVEDSKGDIVMRLLFYGQTGVLVYLKAH